MLSASSGHRLVPSVKMLSSTLCQVTEETLGSAGALRLPILAHMHVCQRQRHTHTHTIWHTRGKLPPPPVVTWSTGASQTRHEESLKAVHWHLVGSPLTSTQRQTANCTHVVEEQIQHSSCLPKAASHRAPWIQKGFSSCLSQAVMHSSNVNTCQTNIDNTPTLAMPVPPPLPLRACTKGTFSYHFCHQVIAFKVEV